MPRTDFNQLLEAGVHFGHLKRKWNPKMAPYIFMEKNGIHIIDLHKTVVKVDEAAAALKQIAKSGRRILFVATKKQAKEVVAEKVSAVNMPYVTERWPGGMLTNFPTIRKAVKAEGKFDGAEKISGETLAAKIEKRGGKTKHGCHTGCVIQCSQVYHGANGKYLTTGFEYETIWGFGANLLIDNLPVKIRDRSQ